MTIICPTSTRQTPQGSVDRLVVLRELTDRVLGLVLGGVTDRVLGLVLRGLTDRVRKVSFMQVDG